MSGEEGFVTAPPMAEIEHDFIPSADPERDDCLKCGVAKKDHGKKFKRDRETELILRHNGRSYHGPHALFDNEELKRIKDQLIGEFGFVAEQDREIIQKIDCALSYDQPLVDP